MILNIYNNKTGWRTDKVTQFTFPDGQPHVKVPIVEEDSFVSISCSVRNPVELFDVVMILETLQRNSIESYTKIYWLFAARMDRPIDNTQPSTFKNVVDILKVYSTKNVFSLLDIHNDKIVPNFHAQRKTVVDAVRFTITDFDENCDIYFPDAGAEKRYEYLVEN